MVKFYERKCLVGVSSVGALQQSEVKMRGCSPWDRLESFARYGVLLTKQAGGGFFCLHDGTKRGW